MEQPPGTKDDQAPQDLPPVLDLTRRDPCSLVRGNSSWCHSADSGSSGLALQDTGPCSARRVGQIQPDNAFSHTTVTLSYVSRSHVFSTHDSLSGNSSVYGVPTFSKYSLQSPCELGETGLTLNQHYLDNVDDGDRSVQTELLQSLSQTQLEFEANTKQTCDFKRKGISNAESLLDTTEHHNDNGSGILQNGDNHWLRESLDFSAASSPQCPEALKVSEGSNALCKKSDYSRDRHASLRNSSTVLPQCAQSFQSSESLLECSKSSLEFSQECLEFLPECSELVPTSSESTAEHLGSSELMPNHLEGLENSFQSSPKTVEVSTADFLQECHEVFLDSSEVVSVSSTPDKTLARQLGDVMSPLEHPESSSATSLDNIDVFMLPEASSSLSGDNLCVGPPDDLSGSLETSLPASGAGTPQLQIDAINESPVHKRKSVLEQHINFNENDCVASVLDEDLGEAKVLNSNTKEWPRTVNKRKLPVRSRKGMQLDTIVMKINSSRYNVSGCIRTGKKSPENTEGQAQLRKSSRLLRRNKECRSHENPKISPKKNKMNASTENCKYSTSDSELRSTARLRQTGSVPLRTKSSKGQSSQSKKSQESQNERCLNITTSSAARLSKPQMKSPSKAKNLETKKPCSRAKTKGALKKRRKILKGENALSLFSPKEPEIKLKYISYKDYKRDSKMNFFKPFIRVQCKEQSPSLCTVVNYPDLVKTATKCSQLPGASTSYLSAVVPATSCLRLGRPVMQGDQQRALVCCLCGQSANAMDLGDLHGPYYSDSYKPPAKRSTEVRGAKEENSSDSDLSDSEPCSTRRKWASVKSVEQRSPAAKRARPDTEDWYSPPVVPLGPCEYWLHEDCGVWSAGVFLVRGRVYGLEEAVRAAQTTKCSSCGDRGASLGCLFKGCTHKFHYRCALRSDCFLMVENFSIRCRKHKMATPPPPVVTTATPHRVPRDRRPRPSS